jgi:hypothetical protein
MAVEEPKAMPLAFMTTTEEAMSAVEEPRATPAPSRSCWKAKLDPRADPLER